MSLHFLSVTFDDLLSPQAMAQLTAPQGSSLSRKITYTSNIFEMFIVLGKTTNQMPEESTPQTVKPG